MTKPSQNKNTHIPVLLDEVLAVLDPGPGHSYLDLTAGYGGHASAILKATNAEEDAVLVDRDDNAIASLHRHFHAATVIHDDFHTASQNLVSEGRQFDMILADLGVSSPHLDNAERGFSIQVSGPLDMRMDHRSELTAETIVNTWPASDLAQILKTYGEEPRAERIANAIIQRRPLHTTTELADAVARGAGYARSRVHPATRTFMALRIAVNDELRLLEATLPLMVRLLKPGGRMAVISFHSLEDRIVKQFIMTYGGDRYDAPLQVITRHPITAGQQETDSNPRARSAKLRTAVKK